MAILVDENTRVLVQGITGREAATFTRGMIEYGTSVVAGVTPGKAGQEIHGVPVFNTVHQAVNETDPNIRVVSVPPAFTKVQHWSHRRRDQTGERIHRTPAAR